jgi:hypothetical protein
VVRLRQGGSGGDKQQQDSMFVALVLGPIWQLYTAGALEQNAAKIATMAKR